MDEAKLKEAVKVLKEVQQNLGDAVGELNVNYDMSKTAIITNARVAGDKVTNASCRLGEVLSFLEA